MARRCKYSQCKAELPAARQCADYMQKRGFCNIEHATQCGLERAEKAKERKERKELREAKERIKARPELAREAQISFNAYIRERDKDLPCISCGRHHQGQYHAGHYRTVGANPELRFEELNVWKQCAPCNNHKSGDIVNYRINLVKRIGQEAVEWLEGPHEPKRYTADQLREIKREYSRKAKELKRL